MGHQICGVIINSLPVFGEKKPNIIIPASKQIRLNNFCPEQLTIGFKDRKTFILLDKLFIKNISDKTELTPLENDLSISFPNTNILIMVINELADFVGYSILQGGEKLRTKATVRGNIFLDYGELLPIEEAYYKKVVDFIDNKTNRKVANYWKYQGDASTTKYTKTIFEIADNLLSEYSNHDIDKYQNGSLDITIIENEILNILGCNLYNLEGYPVVQFSKKKISFKKESLKEFIDTAYNLLHPTTL